MSSKRIGFLLSITLFFACILYTATTYETLSNRVAVQFDLNNKPVSWQDKSDFTVLYLCFLIGLNILFLLILPNLIRKIPHSLINVPWKKYWFSTPQKRLEALDRLQIVLVYTGVFVNAVYLFVYHVIHQENTSSPFFRIPVDIGVYFILLTSVVLIVGMFLYMRPPKE